tara:strand:+ start:526 stop:1254 length:729 start_codon:yes stop_codon:yes gene_type:complete
MLKTQKQSISVIVPAFNEELNLSDTLDSINASASGRNLEVEIIIVNDGSKDNTGEVADLLASEDPRVRSLHHKTNKGLGNTYFTGVKEARKDYVVLIPGDNECGVETLTPLLDVLGSADIIIPYPVNTEIRSVFRRIVSKSFVSLVNSLAGLKLYYYNGTVVHRRDLLQSCPIRSNGFVYQAKILIYMLYNGASFQQVPIKLNRNKARASTAFRFSNLISVSRSLIQIFLYRLFRREKWFST